MNFQCGTMVLGVTHVCAGGILFVLCVDPRSWPEFLAWWGGTRSWSSNFCFHISLEATHKCDWSQESRPRWEPKGAFLWGLEALLPNLRPALFCLSCQISLHSLPQCFGPGQVILVPSLLLGKESLVQPSIFKWLFFPAACFPSGSLSPSPFQACSSLLPVPATGPGSLGCLAGLCLGMEIWLLLDAFPHPTQPLTSCFLFVFSSSSGSLEQQALSPISFLSPASSCCSSAVDLFSVGQTFIFHVDCFSNKAVAQCWFFVSFYLGNLECINLNRESWRWLIGKISCC